METFKADTEAVPVPPYTTVFLSQRDLSIKVPVNYVTVPGVSLSSACFADFRYEDGTFQKCLSNLLSIGFRRLELDLFWDEDRRVWSFCPVSVPLPVPNAAPPTSTGSFNPATASSARISMVSISARQADISALSSSDANSRTTVQPSTSTQSPLTPSINGSLVSLGPYTCTATINLSIFTTLLLDYIQSTQNTLESHLIFLILNLHASSSANAPTLPAPSVTRLPDSSNLLGTLLSSNLTSFMYTPANLMSDRANLNGSWYTVPERFRPANEFYSTEINLNGIVSTSDGWPSESFIKLSRGKRLLVQMGRSEPQLSQYNFTADQDSIFANGYVGKEQADLAANSTGGVTSGCYVINDTPALSRVNSSWATVGTVAGFPYPAARGADLSPFLTLTANITDCGISPILNSTLLNATAQEAVSPYQNFSYSTIWSWAPGEPMNFSSANSGTDELFRCATKAIDGNGRWSVEDCSQKRFAACRALGQPYNWTITDYKTSYSFADDACPANFSFAVPRTALENSYLSRTISQTQREYDDGGIWLDFNSLDLRGCWTAGGPNSTCPWSSKAYADSVAERSILVPTVAAIIVLVITALTGFVKVAGNRKVKKRTRTRANNGFIYEGVPS